MDSTTERVTPADLDEIIDAVAGWQQDGAPVQMHPGDLGWNASFGLQALADGLRVWRRAGTILAVGMLDQDSGLIRMAMAPRVGWDQSFAAALLASLVDPDRGVLPAGRGLIEARSGAAFRDLLSRSGWTDDEAWTPLRRDLAEPVEDSGLRIETIDAERPGERIVRDRVAVQRAAFPSSTFTAERWQAMVASHAYRRARCLVAYDAEDHAVAATTVWSAGEGRPGLIEPLGAHPAYRGHGHGRLITLAAATALRDMGASSVSVCTPSRNVAGVATYVSAGFAALPAVTDFRRPG